MTNLWRYNVNRTNLPAAWTTPGYADTAWPAGGGLLYVEESALPAPKTTALPLASTNLARTCYFRTRFTNNVVNPFGLSLG